MKIAILSMQRIVNFGSVLQAYSLREMVREATGETAAFLDIEQEPSVRSHRTVREVDADYAKPSSARGSIVRRGKKWLIRKLSAQNKKLIGRFMRDELRLDDQGNAEEYDCVIVGSDEVFNHVKGVRLQLHGEIRQAKKAITYAASCGSAAPQDIMDEDVPRVRQALENFSAISVRDAGTQRYVQALCSKETIRHMDPVLMGPLRKRKPGRVLLRPYLLVYAYGQRIHAQEEIDAIRSFAKKKGLLTVAIGGSQYWCDLFLPVSPMRMLDYFAAAKYVVTDTFHGVVFSVLHHRKFAALVRRSNENKLAGLLEDLGLENRRADDPRRLSEALTDEIDYERVDAILDRERARAGAYLKEQLFMNNDQSICLKNDDRCTGCGACMTVCPKGAITMRENEYGFKVPVIDEQACIRCGKCIRACAEIDKQTGAEPLEAYAAVGRCDELVKSSASGGIFASLAMSWIQSGGLVAGAVMDMGENGLRVYHLLSGKEEDVRRMQGSKYVQSDAWLCFNDVINALDAGRRVLFSGTPCQIAAIRALTGDPDNLMTIDLICHGVPPVKMLDAYLTILQKRFSGRVAGFTFRDKHIKKHFCARIDMKRHGVMKSLYLRSHDLSYYRHFLEGSTYRENCYSCPYANMKRRSDITIGDYWGIDEAHGGQIQAGQMPRRNDWSCLLVNSTKGRELIAQHGGQIDRYLSKSEWIAEKNQQLNAPSLKPVSRDRLLKRYRDGGYAAVEAEFIRESGGSLRYMLRLIRNQYRNRRSVR